MSSAVELHTVETTYFNLSDTTRELLVCLAPFTSVVNRDALKAYHFNLKQLTSLSRLPLDHWDAMLDDARRRKFIQPHPVSPVFIAIPSTVSSFLRFLLEQVIPNEIRNDIVRTFYVTYSAGAKMLYEAFASEVPSRREYFQSILHVEYENFWTAMEMAIAQRWPIGAIYSVMNNYLMQVRQYQRGVELGEKIFTCLQKYGNSANEDEEILKVTVASATADHIEMLGDHEAAEARYQTALAAFIGSTAAKKPERQWHLGMIYYKLGLLAYRQRHLPQAEEYLQKCLKIQTDLGEINRQAEALKALGRVAKGAHDWAKAKRLFKRAIERYASQGNRLLQANVCIDLAAVEACDGKNKEAKKYCRQALAFFNEFGERERQAHVYYNLGDIAQSEGQYDRRYCQ